MQKLRAGIISVVILVSVCALLICFVTAYTEKKELNQLTCYELYSSYVKVRGEYRVYYMVNPNKDRESVIYEIFTDSFITEIIAKMKNTGYGDYPIRVYLISPSDELPYGWKKSELNISSNFDQSVFHRNTYSTVTVPFEAENIHDCILEHHR